VELSNRYNDAYREALDAGTLKAIQYPKFDPADPIEATR
jgi:hypothetical protein